VFCDRLFKKFSDIEKHLKLAHQDNVRYFHSAELFEEYAGSGYVLTCGICSEDIDGKVFCMKPRISKVFKSNVNF